MSLLSVIGHRNTEGLKLMEETTLQSGRNPNYTSLVFEPVCKPSEQWKPESRYNETIDGYEQPSSVCKPSEQRKPESCYFEIIDGYEQRLSCSEQKAETVYNDIDETQLQATPECHSHTQRDVEIRPQPPVPKSFIQNVRQSVRREKTQVSDTMCHCNRFVVLLVVVLIVVTVTFSVVVAKFLIGEGDPTTTPIITTTPITTTSTREEFYGRMWLGALQYDPSTYGKSTSPEYQQLETKFCSKTKATLSEKPMTETIDKCEVTTFSKGSVVVHFTIFTSHVLVWRDTQKMLTDTLHEEMEKHDGQFHEYLKKDITPKVTFNADDTFTTTHIQSTTKTTFQSPKLEPTSNRPTATTTMTMPTTKSSMTTTNPTTTKTTNNPTMTTTTTNSMATTTSFVKKTTLASTYCQIHSPCQNGGTCVNLVRGSHVCVCPKCNCSSVAPFGDCEIDMATICRPEDLPPHDLVPHPYDCQKYVKCTSDGRATTIEYVWEYYNNRFFNPDTDLSEQLSNVRCARETVVRHMCADVTCANGGRCEDTPSGFKCH